MGPYMDLVYPGAQDWQESPRYPSGQLHSSTAVAPSCPLSYSTWGQDRCSKKVGKKRANGGYPTQVLQVLPQCRGWRLQCLPHWFSLSEPPDTVFTSPLLSHIARHCSFCAQEPKVSAPGWVSSNLCETLTMMCSRPASAINMCSLFR